MIALQISISKWVLFMRLIIRTYPSEPLFNSGPSESSWYIILLFVFVGVLNEFNYFEMGSVYI